jgi:hypothetical protein
LQDEIDRLKFNATPDALPSPIELASGSASNDSASFAGVSAPLVTRLLPTAGLS